jgi:serine/threonine-protein kinase
MAPEQWRSGIVGTATDVYAATAVFYECLTGEGPYPLKGLWALAAAHRLDPIPTDRVPEPLRWLVARGLAKDAADRPDSAAAFLEELEEVALAGYGADWEERGRARLAALAALLAALFPMAGRLPTASTALALTRLGRKRLGVAAGVLVGALAAGGGGAVVLAGVSHHVGPKPSATTSPALVLQPSPNPAPPAPAHSPSPGDSGNVPPEVPTTPPITGPPPTTSPSPAPSTTSPVVVVTPPNPIIITPPKLPKPPIAPTTVSGLTASLKLQGSAATATVSLTVHGPGTVTVTAVFSSATTTGIPELAAADADPQTVRSGSHTLTFTHTYDSRCPAAHVDVTTSPPPGLTGADANNSCGVVGKVNG